MEPVGPDDLDAVARQLRRRPRGVAGVAHRCACGQPDVVMTEPRLPDGSPFPTVYYLTCPRATGAVSGLEATGVMRELEHLLEDPEVAGAYQNAHEAYIADRESISIVPELAGVSAGGMPTRVKCLHVLVAHSLAVGPGVNPIGDEALRRLRPWGERGQCALKPEETP